jgi:hypothetical protein
VASSGDLDNSIMKQIKKSVKNENLITRYPQPEVKASTMPITKATTTLVFINNYSRN